MSIKEIIDTNSNIMLIISRRLFFQSKISKESFYNESDIFKLMEKD